MKLMMKLILRKYKAVKYIHKKALSWMLAWVINTPLHFEEKFYFLKGFLILRLLKSVPSYYFLKYFF